MSTLAQYLSLDCTCYTLQVFGSIVEKPMSFPLNWIHFLVNKTWICYIIVQKKYLTQCIKIKIIEEELEIITKHSRSISSQIEMTNASQQPTNTYIGCSFWGLHNLSIEVWHNYSCRFHYSHNIILHVVYQKFDILWIHLKYYVNLA